MEHEISTSLNDKMLKILTFLAFKLSDVVFVMLINFKMPTIVGILIFRSRIIFVISYLSMEKSCITLWPSLEIIKLIFMLSSTEKEISIAYKILNTENIRHFLILTLWVIYLADKC